MKFLSIKEFFYKLNTIGFILLLAPLAAFIFLYLQRLDMLPVISGQREQMWLLAGCVLVFLIDLTIVHWYLASRLKSCKKRPELASRLDGFFTLAVIRMATYCGGALLAAVGFYLTGSAYFTILFVLIELAGILQWPTPSSFCNQFELQGSEREMVLHNRDLSKK